MTQKTINLILSLWDEYQELYDDCSDPYKASRIVDELRVKGIKVTVAEVLGVVGDNSVMDERTYRKVKTKLERKINECRMKIYAWTRPVEIHAELLSVTRKEMTEYETQLNELKKTRR